MSSSNEHFSAPERPLVSQWERRSNRPIGAARCGPIDQLEIGLRLGPPGGSPKRRVVSTSAAVDTMWTPTLRDKEAALRRPSLIQLISLIKFGASEGIRTLDPNLGKVAIVSAATSRLRTLFCGGRPSLPMSENTVLITVLNL
jgi:hypothetical protein